MIVPNAFPEMNTYVNNLVTEFISIQGNIGAGKSTLINILKKPKFQKKLREKLFNNMPLLFVDEPVTDWTVKKYQNNTKSALDYYYEDKIRWGLTFQIKAFTTRMQTTVDQTLKLKEKTIIISERSMTSDKNVFFKTIKPKITAFEWDTYSDFYNLICYKLNQIEKRMIVLVCSSKECYNRIKSRGRLEEIDITEEYLNELEFNQNLMIDEFEKAGGIVYRFHSPHVEDMNDLENFVDEFIDKIV